MLSGTVRQGHRGMSSTKHKESGTEPIEDLVAAWHAYGEQFTVFVPAQQPAPSSWEPDVPEFDEKGRVNPH